MKLNKLLIHIETGNIFFIIGAEEIVSMIFCSATRLLHKLQKIRPTLLDDYKAHLPAYLVRIKSTTDDKYSMLMNKTVATGSKSKVHDHL